MLGCNPCTTPMEARLKLSKNSVSPTVDSTEYRSLIGSLRYLLHTRPNLTFSVCYLSWSMEEPRQEHLAGREESTSLHSWHDWLWDHISEGKWWQSGAIGL
jgi:hypothetical protein